jgi:hypothetical protein
VGRDWDSARRNKDAYWAERIERLGPAESFRIAEELRREVLLLHPTWPDSSDLVPALDEIIQSPSGH